jgi:hypothetical protein
MGCFEFKGKIDYLSFLGPLAEISPRFAFATQKLKKIHLNRKHVSGSTQCFGVASTRLPLPQLLSADCRQDSPMHRQTHVFGIFFLVTHSALFEACNSRPCDRSGGRTDPVAHIPQTKIE